MRKKRKNYRYFFHYMGILFFVLILVILVANILIPTKGFSQKENRVLASRPAFSPGQVLSGNYEKKYETYVNDQFLFRNMWVTLKAGMDRVFGKTEENGVYLGKDGYLMESFSPLPDDRIYNTIHAMTEFSNQHSDLKKYALIAPNSVNILSDKLPAFAPALDQNPYLDNLKQELEASGTTFIDVRDILSEHKDEDQIYYRTDHHWTTTGAYYAYQKAVETMELSDTEISYEKLPASMVFQGTLSAKSGFRSNKTDELDVFLPKDDTPSSIISYVDEQKKTASFYDTSQLEGRDKYALFFGGNHSQVKISTPAAEDRTILILKDSYANSLVPFLTPHYRNIIMVDPRYYYGNLEKLIQTEGVQEVLYLYNANTFFSDSSLELALTPEDIGENTAPESDNAAPEDTAENTATDVTAPEDTDAAANNAAADDTTSDDAAYDDSTYDDSTYDDSTYDDTAYDDSSYDDSTYDDSSYDDSTYDDTAYDDSTYDDMSYDGEYS